MKNLRGKYIWIWQVNQCDNGDIGKIIARAKDLGLTGYLVKTDNGSNHNYRGQLAAVKQLRAAGIKIGGWNYPYGKNVQGEIDAFRKTFEAGIDFYVVNAESPYNGEHKQATQLMEGIQKINAGSIPVGYCTYALASYHITFPYEEFSQYCDFTMPMVYWATMKRQLPGVFNDTLKEYSRFGLPVYPVGQIYDAATPQEITYFEQLCRDNNIPITSYWDYQHAKPEQINALKNKEVDNLPMSYEKTIQTKLKQGGYDPGEIDGIIGTKTISAFEKAMTDLNKANARIAAAEGERDMAIKSTEEYKQYFLLLNKLAKL